jgi:hypothetical protein
MQAESRELQLGDSADSMLKVGQLVRRSDWQATTNLIGGRMTIKTFQPPSYTRLLAQGVLKNHHKKTVDSQGQIQDSEHNVNPKIHTAANPGYIR